MLPALELRELKLRSASYPFDWLISPSFEAVITLVENGFEDFTAGEHFYQMRDRPSYYRNIKYKLDFYHDFDERKSFDSQIDAVAEKYARRIKHFYETAQRPTLFLRYVSDAAELEYIKDNYERIQSLLKSFNPENDILFVANSDLARDDLSMNIWCVEKDENDYVARTFLQQNEALRNYLLENVSYKQDDSQYKYVPKKKSLPAKALKLIRRKLNLYYHHNQTVNSWAK